MGKANYWPQYNTELKARGSTEFLFKDFDPNKWYENGRKFGRKFSDYAIKFFQIARALLGGTLRATQGLIESLFNLKKLDLEVPDYSTISRRLGGLDVTVESERNSNQKIHAVID